MTMEEEATNKEGGGSSNDSNSFNYDTLWSLKTNWTIADGSLVNSITFESSLSPTINDDDDVHQNSNSNPTVKSPLILHPPSPDPSPCEITINFAQKYEVQQVYVRSTARVYEIYYTSDLGSSNEYLCTVRCGVASGEEEVPGFEAAAHLTGACKESVEKKSKSGSSVSTNEDGWVEVKSLDSPPLDNRNSPLPSILNAKQGENLQDLYEATAQINDAEPCMSITLRMLSLQNKGCVFVDEIYVFGDPVEPLDSDNRGGQVENQAGSSFMAMFMPTLLQLSRTRSAGDRRVDHTVDTEEKHASQGIGPKSTNSTEVASKILQGGGPGSAYKQEEKIQETVMATSVPSHVEKPAQISDAVSKADSSSSRIERVLDELVLRVSRMEDLFLRFEERMLKPINSIDARLQRVEQQLNEKPQNSGLRCTRISAPEFSWHESDDNFFGNSESIVVEPVVIDYTESSPADCVTNSSNEGQSHSKLLVTHPVSSNADGEEENNALLATVAANEQPKHAMSVDDALASALAGFLSSVSAKPPKYTQALAIKAPDFSIEEDSTSGKKASLEVQGERATDSPLCCNTVNVNECANDSLTTSTNIPCLESEVEASKRVNDHHSEIAGEGVDDQCLHNEEGKVDSLDRDIYSMEIANEDIKNTEVGDRMNNTSDDECETKNQFLENQSVNGSCSSEDGAILNSESTISEVQKDRSDKDILQDFKFSLASSVVDFEIPLLDVKFIPQENLNAKSPFEVLLDDIRETSVECQCAKEHDGSQNLQQHNLISVDGTEPTNPASGNHFSLDMNYCSLDEMPLYAEVEELHNYNMSKKEACAASLI